MLSKKDLYKTSEYWVEELQNEIYRQVTDYMQKYNLNQNELAEKWGVSKGYVSQILKGSCNFSLKKLVELSLALEKAPIVQYVPTDVYYEIEKISEYMEQHMNKPISISSQVKTTLIKEQNIQPVLMGSINPTPSLTVIKNDNLLAA